MKVQATLPATWPHINVSAATGNPSLAIRVKQTFAQSIQDMLAAHDIAPETYDAGKCMFSTTRKPEQVDLAEALLASNDIKGNSPVSTATRSHNVMPDIGLSRANLVILLLAVVRLHNFTIQDAWAGERLSLDTRPCDYQLSEGASTSVMLS
eukprot:1702395-Amphidinium_carterae.1